MVATASALGLTGCLDDGSPLADYEAWLRNNGYLVDPDAAAADVTTADAELGDTDGELGDTDTAETDAVADVQTAGDVVDAPDVPVEDMGSVNGCPIRVAGTACSAKDGKAVGVSFANGCSGFINVYWVDFACQENKYHEIGPGQNKVQSTFAGHIWRLRDQASGQLLREYVVPSSSMLEQAGVP